MTFAYGNESLRRLKSCHPLLQDICNKALEQSPFDLTILEGFRGEEKQNQMVREGRSQLQWPRSKHNKNPSKAVDIAPYPIDWNNTMQFHVLAGIMFAVADRQRLKDAGYRLRWGGDWNGNWSNRDQSFHDLPHFELTEN